MVEKSEPTEEQLEREYREQVKLRQIQYEYKRYAKLEQEAQRKAFRRKCRK